MRRNWIVAALVVALLAIVVAALAMRFTDDGGQPAAEEWAGSVCSSLTTWKTSIESLADVSSGELTADTLRQKIDEAEAATSQLVTDLEDLGPPDLESGDELRQELDDAATELESSVETLRQSADEAIQSAGSPREFLQSLASLAPQFQALLDDVTTTVDDLRNANVAEDAKAELQVAFDEAPACQELRGTG